MAELETEVSIGALRAFEPDIKRLGLDFRKIIGGPDLENSWHKRGARVSWEVFACFLERLEQSLGGPSEVSRLSRRIEELPGNEAVAAVTSVFTSPKLVYWAMARWFGPSHFRNVNWTYTELEDGRVQVVAELPATFRGSPMFFRVLKLGFECCTRMIAHQDSLVEAEISSHRGAYLITPPPRISLLGRMKNRLKIFPSARTAVEELASREREIRRYYDRLSDTQRALFEQEARLKLSTEMAALARMSSLGEMAGGVAHEINNPLSVILLNAEQLRKLLKKGALDAEHANRMLSAIIADTNRVAGIVRALRLFSRDAGDDPVSNLRLSEVLDEALRLCRERSKSLGVELRLENHELAQVLELEGRAAQIGQVMLNCLNNAIDAAVKVSDRWIRVDVRELGDRVELSITDSGPGIPPEIRERLFEPFFTTKALGQGTGLGLSTSRGIVESHGGEMFFDLEHPHTRIMIRLPRRQSSR